MSHLLPWMPRTAQVAAVVSLGLLVAGHASARVAVPGSIVDCAAIVSDRERLACYDRASGRVSGPAAGVGRAPEPRSVPISAPDASAKAATPANPNTMDTDSMIDSVWGFDPESDRYTIRPYRPNYLALASYSTRPNEKPFKQLFSSLGDEDARMDSIEAQFQISFKARLWATDDRRFGVWGAYTQKSQWQVYNDETSRPFRETNYQPELFVSYNPGLSHGGFHWRLFNFGYNHQSNGRADPLSRGWDRLIAEFGVERGDFALLVRPWVIIDDGEDDNPDIEDYMGWGDITAVYKWRGNSFTLMGRGNPDTEKGAAKLTWTTAPILGPLRGYVSAFTGYGETLIDYNWKQSTFGIGFTLNDLLDRPAERN